MSLLLPGPRGSLTRHVMGQPKLFNKPVAPLRSRRAFAAAHVVADPMLESHPSSPVVAVDWDATMAFRRHLWSWGLPVADAMDTAQRGMGMGWEATRELIARSATEAAAVGGDIACGANTDQLAPGHQSSEDIINAYLEQINHIENYGAQAVIMASRNLAYERPPFDTYAEVYESVLAQVQRPVILHWLGEVFDPELRGYWGSANLDEATEHFLSIVASNAARVDGVKISLLDQARETYIRSRLPAGVLTYTGDDFDYPDTILGDGNLYSHALLGAFDLIAPAASTAIQALDRGDVESFYDVLSSTVPLARHVFSSPTQYYKTGIVFMAYLAGHQSHFRMIGGLQCARSVMHLTQQFKFADAAGLFSDPDLASHRMALFLEVSGVPQ